MTVSDQISRATMRTAIENLPGRNLWLLSTRSTSYVVGVDDAGLVTQRYWGRAIPATALAELDVVPRHKGSNSWQRPEEVDEQLPVDGGARWAVPSLQVRFASGIRSLELEFDGAQVETEDSSDLLHIRLVDRAFSFGVTLHYRVREGSDVIERWISLRNGSDRDSVSVLRADSGSWLIPDQDDYRVSSVHGHWGGEFQLERQALPVGEFRIGSRQGSTGQTANPWVMIDDGSAREDSGEVRTVALAWSGSWRLSAQRRPEGTTAVTTGFGHDGLEWILQPGESLVTPATLGLYSTDGFGGASREWHRYVRTHVLEHGAELAPVLYNSWEAIGFDLTIEKQLRLAKSAARLGVELFVVDDGWFGKRTNDARGLGDWDPNPDRFPNGLQELVSEVRSLGMGFGIWVEPEMVNADSDLYRAHPDWILHWPQRTRTERRNQLVLNLARADVREYTLDWLDRLVADAGCDFIKWDMNRPFTEAGWPERGDSQDSLWIDHTRGVYWVLSALRERHPQLRIEACASGGARTDLAILRHTDQIWISDNTDSLDRQPIQNGFSQLYPAQVMSAWVTDFENQLTHRLIPLDYRFHVAMAGNLGIGADLNDWDDDDFRRGAAHIATYKRIRETVQFGDQYRLGGDAGRAASAIEYIRGDEVVVFAYEPHRSLSTGPRRIRLLGLDATASYEDATTGYRHSGALLAERGLEFNAEANAYKDTETKFSTADYASSLTILHRVSD
jgi:alpha-galactosidase